ncbi:hypothetical protein B0H13DRAFT_1641035, partial [Mycena leptocephala]
WRDTGLFVDITGPKKWRAEACAVCRDPFGVHDYPSGPGRDTEEEEDKLNFAFEMERAACFGSLLTACQCACTSGRGAQDPLARLDASTKSMYVPGESIYSLFNLFFFLRKRRT